MQHSLHRRILVSTLFLFLTVIGGIAYVSQVSFAETSEETITRRRAELQQQLTTLENLLDAQQKLLNGKQDESASLQRDLKIMDANIEKARIGIRAQEVAIAGLENSIFLKQASILELTEKIDTQRESLAGLIQRTAEIDQQSLVEMIFSGKTISEFFVEVDDVEAVKQALQVSAQELEGLRLKSKVEKGLLDEQHVSQQELRELQLMQRDRLKSQEAEKARLLNATKGDEKKYQSMINKTQQTAAQIRSELFELRGTAAINLGDAIEFANFASLKTGVRPAFLLGVLKQETRLGEFLGDGNWNADMHPTRDRPLFKVITSTLGLDPSSMPVSAAPSYGYGGAMGPAQFIPSTWACYGGYINGNTGDCNNAARSFEWDAFWAGPWTYNANADNLRTLRGKQSPSNPWDNQDAFLAAAVLMRDNGADAGGPEAERMAALRYFAGWGNASNPAYAFYGDGVMEHAAYFQQQINALKQMNQ
jgi:membrane-bound lytic murein transglycosylase B